MKNLYNEKELLSAYIDGELTSGESAALEEKLVSSKKLQTELAEMKKIKQLTSSSIKELDENPYFETRLNAELNSDKNNKSKLKKWYPVLGFSVITLALMFILKLNPNLIENLVEEQRTNLSGFYTENLKPLLLTAGFTNEDIFNFAFSKQLPLDKSNTKYLFLGSKSNGDNYFEIKNAGIIPDINFNKFVEALNLNRHQKHQMDSILDSYADDLQSQVLVNNKSTVAINQNLWNYHKAIFADIMAFAKDANRSEFNKIIPAGYTFYDRPEVGRFVTKIKNHPDSQYIFITPDSVFTTTFKFDKDKFKAEMEKFHKELKKNLKNFNEEFDSFNFNFRIDSSIAKLKKDKAYNKNFKIYIDSNLCRVDLGNIDFPQIQIPDFDSIAAQIDEAAKSLSSFSFSIPKFDVKNNYNFKEFKFKIQQGDSVHSFKIPMPNIDSLIGLHGNLFAPGDTTAFKFFMNDSLLNKRDFRKQMEMLHNELEKMRRQMDNLRKDLKNESEESQSVEI